MYNQIFKGATTLPLQVEAKLSQIRSRPKNNMRFLNAIIAFTIILTVAAGIGVAAVYVPQVAIYVSILAIGLALALQKYIASFFAYFVINFSGIYDLEDRIRIGNMKGDVRRVGLFHTTLEEVGEDEKLGGELTGRLIQVPNLLVLDQPVLNYSKDYLVHEKAVISDYMFDEVRIPISNKSNVKYASKLLEDILKSEDEPFLIEARQVFQKGYPRFLDEAMTGPRVLVYVEPERIWIKGKFVAPLKGRNDLRTRILLKFFDEIAERSDIRLA